MIVPNALNLPYRIKKKILEMRNLWVYGFEKPFTIFELKRRMRGAGITPIKSSGAQIITSLLTFLQLIRGEASPKTLEPTTSRSMITRLFTIPRRIDEHLERIFGALLGKNIGVKDDKFT